MTVLKRAWRIVQTQVEQWLDPPLDDPAERLEQLIAQMHQELFKLRQATAQAIATQKRTERQVAQNQASAQTWHQRAQLALAKGDETIAREALTRRQGYLETAAFLQTQISQQQAVSQKLKQDLQTLEQQYEQAKIKKELCLARLHSAQATQSVQAVLHESGANPWALFEQVEAEILALEAQAEMAADVTNSLEEQFAQLERQSQVETELKQLRSPAE
ncbi:MAG: PspA/IM30 family protein [Spirulina sp. SIO3F2]|nr:PspA/IM30 family protein [Spirulina sp. SIO3F2]